MRELTTEELDYVAGGWYCPPSEPGPGNPGNLKPVGNAGETPSGNLHFIAGTDTVPIGNGRAGTSAA